MGLYPRSPLNASERTNPHNGTIWGPAREKIRLLSSVGVSWEGKRSAFTGRAQILDPFAFHTIIGQTVVEGRV